MLLSARKKLLPYLLIALAAIACLGAIAELRGRLYYPSVKIHAPEGIEITFLFGGRTDRTRCETVAANVSNSILAVCTMCEIGETTCLDSLGPQHRKLLSAEPLDLPSARL